MFSNNLKDYYNLKSTKGSERTLGNNVGTSQCTVGV